MPAAFPPEIRTAVVAARLAGARVTDVARQHKISTSLVTKWCQEAGIGTQPLCRVCQHPRVDEVDAALIDNTVAVVAAMHPDLSVASLDRHRRVHLGVSLVRGMPCAVCHHDDRTTIDLLLGLDYPRPLLSEIYLFEVHVLRHHQFNHLNNPDYEAALAKAHETRLQAARKLAERAGPPRGWMFCPECDSDNVRCAGSGDWREDPGPLHWHVTDCFDCGWPSGDA